MAKQPNYPAPKKRSAIVTLLRWCFHCKDHTEHLSTERGTYERIECKKCGNGSEYRTR